VEWLRQTHFYLIADSADPPPHIRAMAGKFHGFYFNRGLRGSPPARGQVSRIFLPITDNFLDTD
jgi:hypothetical protein